MKYYSVQFYYNEPLCNIHDDEKKGYPASSALTKAENTIIEVLDAIEPKLIHKHEYSWPDGSLYRYVAYDGSIDSLKKIILNKIKELNLDISIEEVHQNSDPHKIDYDTLEAYMNSE